MTRKLYGIIPYVLLDEPLTAARVCFESHRAGLKVIVKDDDISRFKELNAMFVDELGHRSHVSTWFLIEMDGTTPDSDVDIAYSRLVAALQFALLESGDFREQPHAETVDAHLFEVVHKLPEPAEGHFWHSRGLFTRSRHVWPAKDTVYPRAPNVRFPSLLFPGSGRTAKILGKLIPAGTPFLALAAPGHSVLDSLSFFVQSCSSPETTDVRARIVLLAAAFEILLGVKSKRGKGEKVAREVEGLLKPLFTAWQPRDMARQLRGLRKFCLDFYDLRSDILHEGSARPERLTFKAKGAREGFVGFFWKARQLYAACVHARLGILEPWELSLILADLVHNEDRLQRIQSGLASGDPDRVRKALALCSELQQYPSAERLDTILGAWRELAELYGNELQSRGKTLHPFIPQSLREEDPSRLWKLFLGISESLRPRFPLKINDHSMFVIEHAASQFADYARYAVLLRSFAPVERPTRKG